MNRDALERLLDRVADGDAEARDDLLDLINRQSPGLRALAHEALEEGGPDMREQLIMTLAHDPELDMGGFRPKPVAPPADAAAEVEAAPPELLYKLSKGSKAERISAARELGNYADPSTVAPLIGALTSGERRLASAAEGSLQKLGRLAVPALVRVMHEESGQPRWHAARVLTHLGDPRATEALIGALEDSNYGTRWLAAEGLVAIGQPVVRPLFEMLAQQEKVSAWLKQGAYHVLNKVKLGSDDAHYRDVARDIHSASAGVIPSIAARELARLG